MEGAQNIAVKNMYALHGLMARELLQARKNPTSRAVTGNIATMARRWTLTGRTTRMARKRALTGNPPPAKQMHAYFMKNLEAAVKMLGLNIV